MAGHVDERSAGSSEEAGIRSRVHGMWNSVARNWDLHSAYIEARAAPITRAILERVEIRRGDHVIELASGPGGMALAIADAVGPSGRVTISDVAPAMTEIVANRAAKTELRNVVVKNLDLEHIEEPDNAFTVALCREGLMFALDPRRALDEMTRVLKPGGRLAVSVWGPSQRNPWLALVFASVSAVLGKPMPPPAVPGPFSLEDLDRLRDLLARAGLSQVRTGEVQISTTAATFEDWWSRTSALAGPLAKVLSELSAERREELDERLRMAVKPYETRSGLSLPGVALVASGHKG